MLSLRTNSSSSNGNAEKEADSGPYELLETMTGASLVGLRYTPLFDYFVDEFSDTDKAFTVVADNYVTDDSGTGVVHCAPAFVEEDHRVCIENKIIQKGKNLTVAVDDDGCFTEKASHFCGRYVKDADKDFINDVKASMKILNSMNFKNNSQCFLLNMLNYSFYDIQGSI
ncbi:hypothetical protein MKW98_028506 [Papaver atlanticum]|uniref:Aminoacyl-tRNA synthetase class Ia domain-containing protein n=1 Tax=Papaver atlanticum TaxID=357466 RepID=A0AAD4XVL3_9MAGN|nr:hypothetical protein MKW98_028506 [Papaver atlanticum]